MTVPNTAGLACLVEGNPMPLSALLTHVLVAARDPELTEETARARVIKMAKRKPLEGKEGPSSECQPRRLGL